MSKRAFLAVLVLVFLVACVSSAIVTADAVANGCHKCSNCPGDDPAFDGVWDDIQGKCCEHCCIPPGGCEGVP
ncbi:MAG: hypothetical protein Kow0074_18430 [Candidatus Zixiibacteriota bacterium]